MTAKNSNLVSRVLVAIVAIPAVVFISYTGGIFFFLFVCAVSGLALNEFYSLSVLKGALPQRMLGIAAAIFLNGAFFRDPIQSFIASMLSGLGITASLFTAPQLFLVVLLLFLFLALTFELFRNKGSVFVNVGYTILGVVYIGAFLAPLVGIRELFANEFPSLLAQKSLQGVSGATAQSAIYGWGGLTIISIFATIWICDSAAYFGGMATGRHKLFPRVSPNKTWEGAAWGFFAAVGTMIAAQKLFLPYLQFNQAIAIGVIIGVFGQIGDLVESLFKRDAGVKDSSTMIPGHGGVLDRFDSLIFVSPILYLYIDLVVLSCRS
ncbi:MAG: phosphatidate cytidylyltransferase [Bacteroidota bacterium]